MALISGGGGDDSTQIRVIVFSVVVALVISMMVPILAPTHDTGVDADTLAAERLAVQGFTGESMVNQTPWRLTGVYTPYITGTEPSIDPDSGWIYGEQVQYSYTGYTGTTTADPETGSTESIYLDPSRKSDTPLAQGSDVSTTVTSSEVKWYYKSWLNDSGGDGLNFIYDVVNFFTPTDPYIHRNTVYTAPTWDYSGYRYTFSPMLTIPAVTGGTESKVVETDAQLSVVWYNTYNQQGISGGLILYNDKTKGIVANYTADEIIESYNPESAYSSKYVMNFDGTKINLNVRFDPDVLTSSVDLAQAWDQGRWSLAFTAESAGSFLDLQNSTSFTASLGSIVDTYIDIVTFEVPNVPGLWSVVLWIICILPLELVVLMFLSRFGIAGVGAGIIGTLFAGGLAIL